MLAPVSEQPVILNETQLRALDAIESGRDNALILGSAGTGKSTFVQYLKNASAKKIICACPTAVSALNIGGQTIHSMFQIAPRDFILPDFLKLAAKPRNVLANADLLIIDEISMVSPDLLDAMDILARMARKNGNPFGGLQVLAIGDLFQLPPVITRAAEPFYEQEYGSKNAYFFDSHAYKRANFSQFSFDFVYRQSDTELLKNLNDLRRGYSPDALQFFNGLKIADDERRKNAVIITPFRAVADNINAARLRELSSPEVLYRGSITGDFVGGDKLPAPEELLLKVGALVVFVRNDAGKHRWHNGSMGIVRELGRVIKVELLGTHEIVEVKPEKWEKIEYRRGEDEKLEEKEIGAYTQFPLMLGYAMTIHKAQGKTLDAVVVDISRGAFAHGQTYVALSRTRSAADIHINTPLSDRDVIFDQRIIDFCS
ncbi:MAG: AAA family ATPase [Rickettsiales bacterium]|jgi:ATP-dependent exoDNAse (exonuclease V) alpha subunit|nr:AAA family ATPase [Rickettsiales bacterium]